MTDTLRDRLGALWGSPRHWLLSGGGGYEGGEDGLRALTISGEGLIDFLQAYHDDLLAAQPAPAVMGEGEKKLF